MIDDTIELLNAIGEDASLRYASADDLALALDRANASDALKSAVAGEREALFRELGHKPMFTPQTQMPGREDEPDEDEGEEEKEAQSAQPPCMASAG